MLLEKVQRRATKMIEGFGKLIYDERLRRTGLTMLEERRIRGDLIETFKMIKGISKVDYTKFFSISENNRTRGNSYKLEKKQCNINIRSSFFSQRVVNHWNEFFRKLQVFFLLAANRPLSSSFSFHSMFCYISIL